MKSLIHYRMLFCMNWATRFLSGLNKQRLLFCEMLNIGDRSTITKNQYNETILRALNEHLIYDISQIVLKKVPYCTHNCCATQLAIVGYCEDEWIPCNNRHSRCKCCSSTCSECKHVGCDKCIEACPHCSKHFCAKCTLQCCMCNENMCSSTCAILCNFCEELTCKTCNSVCVGCDVANCSGCLKSCDGCGTKYCDGCLRECERCDNSTCHGCCVECSSCNDNWCSKCAMSCAVCDEMFCSNCVCNGMCQTCTKEAVFQKRQKTQ